jgi:hypothetical protein
MMREAENQKLARIFWELVDGKKLSPAYDRDTLLGWMHKNAGRFHIPRLWQLLDRNRSRSRYEATSEGVFGIYCSIDWDAERDQCEKDVHERPVRRIMAGLYREEDPISCEVCYYLYPHQPNKEWSSEKVEIELKKDKWHRLRRSDRAGWCIPLNWGKDPPISFLTLNVKAEGRLRTLKQLVFPNRTHWVLVADPLSSGSVPFANWGSPVVNRSFVVLCRVGLEATMNLLKDKGLISWTGVRTIQNAEQSWKEYIGCTMLTADWPRLELREHQSDFVESLRPNSKALIYFIDGLRVPHERDCWLENYSPRLEILATAGSVSLYCEDLVSGKQQPLGDHSVNTPVHLPSLVPGFYRIGGTLRVAKGGGGKDQELAPRRIEIRSWDRLECRAETPLALSSDLAEEVLS